MLESEGKRRRKTIDKYEKDGKRMYIRESKRTQEKLWRRSSKTSQTATSQ